MTNPNDLPQTGYMTAKAVKQRYAISNSTLYQWIADKRLPAPIKIGARAVRFRIEDLNVFEAGLAVRVKAAD